MSNFKCEKCGANIIDSKDGYIAGCVHYPLREELIPITEFFKFREYSKEYFDDMNNDEIWESDY